jgi:hypothetical protein
MLSSIPVCDPLHKYLGFILKTDLRFIILNDRYDLLKSNCQQFLEFLNNEK